MIDWNALQITPGDYAALAARLGREFTAPVRLRPAQLAPVYELRGGRLERKAA